MNRKPPESFKQELIMTRIKVIIWKHEDQASQGKAGAGVLAEEECERWSPAEAARGTENRGFWILDA